jgi:hypothetical protein
LRGSPSVEQGFYTVNPLAAISRNLLGGRGPAALRSSSDSIRAGGIEGRNVVASVAEERELTDVDSLPIDVETISATVDLAWGMALSTSKREEIDARTSELIGHMSLLLGQTLGEDQEQNTLRLLRLVERHLASSNRPTRRTQAHEAFNFMRDSAVFLKALLSAYQMTNKTS